MTKHILALVALLAASAANAQSVQQSGTITPGHGVKWTTNGVISDAGTSTDGTFTSLGVQNNGGKAICVNTGPSTDAGRQQFCLQVDLATGGKLSIQNFGTAPAGNIGFVVNGVSSQLALVALPTTIGDAACFTSATGAMADCGFAPLTNVLTSAHLFVGNASNIATDTAVTGDWSITNTGVVTVGKVNGVSYPASPSTGTIPVVTAPNTITYQSALPSGSFANPTNPGVNLTGSNGVATTAMRSDAVLVLDQSIAPTWTGRHIWGMTPTYNLASNALGVGTLTPLDAATHTVAAGKQFDHHRISQSGGGNNKFLVGANGIVMGYSSYLEADAASDSTANMYPVVGNGTNNGAQTVKAGHFAVFGAGTSTGVLIAGSFGITPTATTNTGSAAIDLALVSSSGINDRVSGIAIRSTGDRFLYGIGNVIAPVPIKTAFLQTWMSSASDPGARAVQVLNHAGGDIAGLALAGGYYGPSITLLGSSSGLGSIVCAAACGTPVATLGTGTGTLVVTAAAPLSINTTTGQLSWTGLNTNGVLYASSTTAVTNTAQGGANSVLVANSGAPSFSDTITVGTSVTSPTLIAGTAGNGVTIGLATISRNNAAGSLTIQAGTNAGNVFALATAGTNRMSVSDTVVAVIPTTAATSSTTGSLQIAGGASTQGAFWAGTYIAVTPTVVNSLPACTAGLDGARAFVTNNNTATAFGGAVTTGGANHHPVYCDGSATAWKQG